MSTSTQCSCESCPGAACQCGCQTPKAEPSKTANERVAPNMPLGASSPLKTTLLATCLLLSFGMACFGETVDGHLMPSKCKKEDPKTHTAKCALICKSSGFGIVTTDGKYRAFTTDGNAKAIALLQSTGKTADLRVSVRGTQQGALLAVESISWK